MSPKKTEFVFSIAVVAFLAWALWEARDWPAQSKLFPWCLGFTVLILAFFQVVSALRAAVKEQRDVATSESVSADTNAGGHAQSGRSENDFVASEINQRRAMVIGFWIVAFFAGISLVGFKLASLFLSLGFLKFAAKENWIISTAIAVGSYLFFWLVFDIGLRVPLGGGWMGEYFGLN